MTIYKPVQELAKRAAEVAVALALGKPVIASASTDNGKLKVPTILHGVVTVTKANVDSTVIADGFQKREEVYAQTGGKPPGAAEAPAAGSSAP
jgi:D-xylose transport system substrate-binding protein